MAWSTLSIFGMLIFVIGLILAIVGAILLIAQHRDYPWYGWAMLGAGLALVIIGGLMMAGAQRRSVQK